MANKTKRFSKYIGDNAARNIPCMLHAMDFFMARSSSVVRLHSALKLRKSSIPRHLRRRVRSFRPYYVRPGRPKNTRITVSRRTRRKKRMYLADSDRFLPTHVWHAKRFHMKNLWGMRLPTNVCNKGERAISRLAKRACLVHDRSYMDCWHWEGKPEEIVPRFAELGLSGMISHSKVISGEFFGNGFIILDHLIVSPYQAMWNENSLIIWTHPSARLEVTAVFSTVNELKPIRSVRFELLGSRAHEILTALFGPTVPSSPGKVCKIATDIFLNFRSNAHFIDIILPQSAYALETLRKLVFAGASPIGVLDRHKYIANFGAPDFPFDFPTSRAGSRQIAADAKAVIDREKSMPPQCRVNTSNIESPFFPDWSLLGLDRLPRLDSLQHVWIESKRGLICQNAHIYSGEKLLGFVTTVIAGANPCCIASVSTDVDLKHPMDVFIRNRDSIDPKAALLRKSSCKSTDSSLLSLLSFN